ncbi:MAG TPA: protein-glutamate O-methyltransferase CheR [Opitutaceae bacterium]|jgi:chemotaxis protein methyltransferase CheR
MHPIEGPAPALIDIKDPVAQLLRDLIHEKTGVFCEAERLSSLIERLQPLAGAIACRSYLDYFYFLKYDDAQGEELKRVLDAISVQETFFWRESDQIKALTAKVLPAWVQSNPRPLRVWSAACASGEEPYSLAIAAEEAGYEKQVEIVATDASRLALAAARRGIYRERSFRVIPPHLKDAYFRQEEGGYAIRRDILSRVRFDWANLVGLTGSEAPGVNVIFCRNVFIYFSHASIQKVLASFARMLPAGGHLFTGASESLFNLTKQFDLQDLGGAFAYVRNSRT